MQDYSDKFPVEPIVGWTTTNYNERERNGEVQQFQGFKGCQLDGALLPEDYYDQEVIAVPEGKFHTSAQFFQPTPEQAIASARAHVERLRAEAARIEASIERVGR